MVRSCALAPGARQRFARNAGARARAEQAQDFALALGEPDDLVAAAQLAPLDGEHERAEFQARIASWLGAPGARVRRRIEAMRSSSSLRLVGLAEIVVDAGLEAADPVGRLGRARSA